MKTKAPAVRRQFANAWDEINYLRDKLLFWLYQRSKPDKAIPFAKRMQKLLARSDRSQESIVGQEGRSLTFEALGDLHRAIEHREKEIHLIRRLRELSIGTPSEDFALRFYGPSDLSDRLDLLATLHCEVGDLEKAIATLRESRLLCEEHGVEFDGADLLSEYLEVHRALRSSASTP